MGLFTTLLNSTGALQVYGRVFNVIENNITNANTPGYARQDQSLVARPFNPAEGIEGGVMAGPMLSARSRYLEQAVHSQQELLGSAQQKTEDLAHIEPLFDTTGKSGVPGALNAFFDSFSQLSINPNNAVSRQSVIDAAGQVASAFRQNAAGIGSVTANLDSQIRGAITTVNQAAAEIASLNQSFRSTNAASGDAGLDARMHAVLESLSQVVNYAAIKAGDGSYSIYLGGQTPLVIGDHTFSITSNFAGAQTAILDSQNNDITKELAGAGGTLGAMLEERNTTLPGYTAALDKVAKVFADSVNTALSQGLDRNGNPPTVNLFTYNAGFGAASTLAVTNITPDQIAAALPGAPGGNGNAIILAQLAGQPLVNGFTLTQAYGNLGGQVGADLAKARQSQASQQDLVTLAEQQRAQVSGVSLDAEATKLLQFQQAYGAVGKLVTVLDSLTEVVMNLIH